MPAANRFRASVAKKAPKATRPYIFYSVFINSELPLVLHCRHAGYSNPATTAMSLKTSKARNSAIADTEANTHERVMALARVDAKIMSHAPTGWDNAIDEEGKPYVCTPELVEEMLLAVIDENPDAFMQFKVWVSDESNFVEMPLGGAADLGK